MEENLQVILVVIVGISFMVGLAALILWIKDRATWTGAIVKRILGAISLFIGLSVAGWIVYNLFYPTEHFRWGPMVFLSLIWVGAKWLFGSEPGLESQDIDWDSAELQAAMQQAKETLPNFIRQVSGGVDQGYVKFPFQTDQGVIEHILGARPPLFERPIHRGPGQRTLHSGWRTRYLAICGPVRSRGLANHATERKDQGCILDHWSLPVSGKQRATTQQGNAETEIRTDRRMTS